MSRRDRWIGGGGGRRANFPGKAKNLKNLKNWGDEAPGAGGSSQPKYSNSGGTGDRQAIMRAATTIRITTLVTANSSNLIDGATGNTSTDAVGTSNSDSGRRIVFDFGGYKNIEEITVKHNFSVTQTHGTWIVLGSNDLVEQKALTAEFTLGGNAGDSDQVITLTGTSPTAGYRFIILEQRAGTIYPSAYIREVEFKIASASGAAAGVGATPSYDNRGGAGGRQDVIIITTTATAGGGSVENLIDGNRSHLVYSWTSGQSTREIVFEFESAKLITEATWRQNSAASHGTWQWQGSNDGSSYSNIGGTFTLGSSATQTLTTLSGNVTAYKFYKLLQTAGTTSSGPYLQEIEFKIGDSATVTKDSSFDKVVFLGAFNGADAATGVSEERGHPLTYAGNAQIDTAIKKFGKAALLLDGTGDYITSPNSADFLFGADPFTVECWVRHTTGFGTNEAYLGLWGSTVPEQAWFFFLNAGSLTFRMQTSGGLSNAGAAWTPTVNTWYHLMADRDASGSGYVRTYINGVMSAKTALGTTAIQNGTGLLGIGAVPGFIGTYDLTGLIDDIRITKGAARCGSDAGFTPPTAAFPRA